MTREEIEKEVRRSVLHGMEIIKDGFFSRYQVVSGEKADALWECYRAMEYAIYEYEKAE